jgi:autotransporter-associated beta strand protein
MGDFVKLVRQAAGGRIVVLLYHGVPDIEHPAVSMDPGLFRAQMQYLKDNKYKVIPLRDLAEYIDPVKGAALPPTSREYKETGPAVLASEEVPAGKVELPPKPAQAAAIPEKKSKTVAAKADAPPPPELTIPTDGAAVTLEGDRAVTVAEGARTEIKNAIAGAGRLVKNGTGQLRLFNAESSYSGGTLVNSGSILLLAKNGGIGSGPITLGEGRSMGLGNVDFTNPLVVDGAVISSGDGWGARVDADIVLNGEASFVVWNVVTLNKKSGGVSGRGGLTMAGNRGPFGNRLSEGRLVLCGTNTYTGPTTVELGTLVVNKAAGLYNADPARWTAANIRVQNAATLVLSAGGPDEFTSEQLDRLLKKVSGMIDNNGLMGGSFFGIDTANAKEPVVISAPIADSKGPGGGPISFKKSGAGTVQMAGDNTFTGRTIIEGGMLRVASLNSVGKGRAAHSSLGVPGDVEAGEILLAYGGLIYTGAGETSDRVMNLAGGESAVTFEQAGTGLFKLTSTFVISGHSASKTIVLSGNTAGTGELAGDLFDPHDRNRKAKTSVTKNGTGIWVLSGKNSYTGQTMVKQGVLSISSPVALSPESEITISDGAMLDLNFKGQAKVKKLTFGGTAQPSGTYSAATSPKFIKGPGTTEN